MLVRGFKSLSFLLSSRLRPLALHHRQRRPSLVSINSRRGLSSSSEMSRFLSNSSGSGEMDGKLPGALVLCVVSPMWYLLLHTLSTFGCRTDCWGHRGVSLISFNTKMCPSLYPYVRTSLGIRSVPGKHTREFRSCDSGWVRWDWKWWDHFLCFFHLNALWVLICDSLFFHLGVCVDVHVSLDDVVIMFHDPSMCSS